MKAFLGFTLALFSPLFALQADDAAPPSTPKGHLVIVGGGLRDSNEAVYRSFLQSADAFRSDAPIGIIPAASGKPSKAFAAIKSALVHHGVAEARIRLIPIATEDDASTPDEDESSWRNRANDPTVAADVSRFAGIWFTGGDQAKILAALRPDDRETELLKAIRALYASGGVIGGTSAGAAIQSQRAILGGSSAGAWFAGVGAGYTGMEEQEFGPLTLSDGLGFLPHGLIDQHFDRKARLGRLIMALLFDPMAGDLGIGIDEDTALVYSAREQSAIVVGTGGVTLIDTRPTTRSGSPPNFTAENIRLSYLTAGDRFDFMARQSIVAEGKSATIGTEYLSIPEQPVTGPFSTYGGRLHDLLGYLLVDNAEAGRVVSLLWNGENSGYRMTFTRDDATKGYWIADDGQADRYTTLDARLDISPVTIQVGER